jgi:excisionase family DNA binding protein
MPDVPVPRFLSLSDVADTLNITMSQVKALVRRGDLVALKIGGRGQWRVESSELEKYIERLYEEAHQRIAGRQSLDDQDMNDQDVGNQVVDNPPG